MNIEYTENMEWDLLDTVDDDEYTYVDETLSLTPLGGQAGTNVSYYVRGVFFEGFEDHETSSTDTVVVNVPGKDIDKQAVNSAITNSTFSLFQNYPNPFNPTTTISLSLMKNSYVTLKVFDMLGREVAILINETLSAGNHKIQFDGSNLESGVYFYEIKTDRFRKVKKLTLLK